MTTQSNNFPIFFTLERVNNGYILTAKEDTGGLNAAEYQKEVVAESNIATRIGSLLRLNTLKKCQPVMFHVEAVSQNTYQRDDSQPTDRLAEAKLAFAHFHSKDLKEGSTLVLQVKDTDTLEVYGLAAERAAKNNNVPLKRVGGIPMLVFPNTKDTKKALSSYVGHVSLHETTHQKLMEWYDGHQVMTTPNQ